MPLPLRAVAPRLRSRRLATLALRAATAVLPIVISFSTASTPTAVVGARPGIPSGSAWSPGTAAFVARTGSTLTLQGRPFRFSGANLYWTGLDENVGGIDPDGPRTVGYPTSFRIRDGLRTARALGATVVRAHTVGVSTGSPLSLEPTLGAVNPAAWDSMDATVTQAGRLGLRLIVPLTDNWGYYHGGRDDYLRWLGLSTADHGAAFYTDSRARSAYQAHVRTVLTHVNRYTGLRYADDPTIMAWELGNEMDYATPDWVQSNALYVKGLAPSQLVAAGRSWRTDWAVLASPAVDISDSHYYPLDLTAVHEDAAAVAAAGKVFVIGEYPSTAATDAAVDSLAADPLVAGAAVWSLFPHADHYGFVQHDDGYTLHVPGDTPAMRAQVASIRRFGAALAASAAGNGGAPAPTGPDVGLVEPPVLTSVTSPGGPGGRQLRWRGSAGAAAYRVQWSSGTASGTSGVLPGELTAWVPPSSTTETTYAVAALDTAGATLATSPPVRVPAAGSSATDLLEDDYVVSGRSEAMVRTPRPGVGVALAPAPGAAGWVAWPATGVTAARFVLSGSLFVAPVVEVQGASGGWVPVATKSVQRDAGLWALQVAVPAGTPAGATTQLRLVWPTGADFAVTRVVLTTGG